MEINRQKLKVAEQRQRILNIRNYYFRIINPELNILITYANVHYSFNSEI